MGLQMRIVSNNFAEIYKDLLTTIYYNPDHIISPREYQTKECCNVELVLTDPTSNLFTNKIRSPKLNYLYPELLYYFLGRNDLEFISKYSTFWNKIANNDRTVNSAYGYLLFRERNIHGWTEYQWAFNSLIVDKNSRQAILRFNKPEHSYLDNKDFVCTLNGIFHIRKNKELNCDVLNFTTTMRSQDVWFGIIYDIPFYTLLQQQMLNHLKQEKYPDLQLGKYTHYILSEHIYKKDFENIEKMLNEEFISDSTPLLVKNLIEPSGNPTQELYLILQTVENNNEYTDFGDELINKIVKFSLRENNE